MIDGSAGDVLDRNGNSSIATMLGRSRKLWNMCATASFQSRNGASSRLQK